jgi:Family of unknown function (DUF6502)
MSAPSTLVLNACLALLKPLVALLLRHGVAYPAFATALKGVFLQAAQEELRAQGATLTDSAVSLRSGLHRRDVREMGRLETLDAAPDAPDFRPMNLASQVVARWLSEGAFVGTDGLPRALPRAEPSTGFDALVASVSSDIRPRAVLDELLRLGLVQESADGVELLAAGFAPRLNLAEMSQLFQANMHDHLAAASQNLGGQSNFLEQSIFVDHITAQSAEHLHRVAAKAWRQAFKTVMQEAQLRYQADQLLLPAERQHRARFGAYFYSQPDEHP